MTNSCQGEETLNEEKARAVIGGLLEFARKYAEQNDDSRDVDEAWDAVDAARLFLAQPGILSEDHGSDVEELGPQFFSIAVLTRPGESVIDAMHGKRREEDDLDESGDDDES